MKLTVMSLFAGIGGFDLAAQHMGWETVVQVELDEWCRQILAKNFPNAQRHANIYDFDATPWSGRIDILCGGFPCQPFSKAGKRLGDQDNRHLWPEMLRVIRDVRPVWVVGENVGGLLTWHDGLVFEQVHLDLEAQGYQVQTFVLPACGVDAPHRRERVWIVAYADRGADGEERRRGRQTDRVPEEYRPQLVCAGQSTGTVDDGPATHADPGQRESADNGLCSGRLTPEPGRDPATANADSSRSGSGHQSAQRQTGTNTAGCSIGSVVADADGLLRPQQPGVVTQSGRRDSNIGKAGSTDWSDWPTQPPLCAGDDGLSARLVRSARQRTIARWRTKTIKAAGNAVVWQVVRQIFRAIEIVENQF